VSKLINRVAFVTGGANGIGLAVSRALAAAKAKVMIADLDDRAAAAAVVELCATGAAAGSVHLDVRDRQAWAQAVMRTESTLGPIDILCNNAGVAGLPDQAIETLSVDAWRWIMGINLDGVFNGMQFVLPGIKARGRGGHIVNTASMAGLTSSGQFPDYCASKFAVVGLSTALRERLAVENIGVSVLCPAFVRTRLMVNSALLRPESTPESVAGANETLAAFEAGMDPAFVGQLVVSAIAANRAYIFTHPADFARWDAINDRIQADRDWAANALTRSLNSGKN
jgi:NAD(P)-dependent dehydrogenase (short-subunit alcohol dehydrogenase family)